MKKQKVTMGDDASTAIAVTDAKPTASSTTGAVTTDAAVAALVPIDVASVRDLEALTLAAAHVGTAKLLEIITELRQTAGASTFYSTAKSCACLQPTHVYY